MNIQEIMEVLPHRYPFLLVDRVLEREAGKRIVAIKNVTMNELFFQGHFPGYPIMPGVLIIEAMAQVAGLMVMEKGSDSLPLFASMDNVKFKAPVRPGDQIKFEVEVLKIKSSFVRTAGKAYVDGKVVAEAEFMCSIVKK
jgi:beta-hydroxyacyl-ACP dehydratase FabZ